ncbi:MAG: PLP-dependent transferase [Gemmatimonadetes bacterium]|nr:PLP-dependent transferase [Gemmatimonadota bacterium]
MADRAAERSGDEPGGVRRSGPSTVSVHAGDLAPEIGGSVVNPIYQTTTFFSEPEGGGEVLYTRYGNNPNHIWLEERISALEGGGECVVFGSGMAAMTAAVLSCVAAGDHVVAARALYGGTRVLLDRELSRLGIETTFVDVGSPGWEREMKQNTRLILLEIPTNPLLRVIDPGPVVDIARARGAAVAVDATFATPINFRGLEHGVDLIVHSATKYFGGHTDVTAGAVCGTAVRISSVRDRARIFGAALDPHAAWLLERGIKTLSLRMARHNENGLRVAEWCVSQRGIARVHYPGLPDHPDHETARRILDGFGGMLSIELSSGEAGATQFVRALRLAKLAPSLGGVETLVSEPRHTSHASLSEADRAGQGIGPGFVRISLGIEDARDIIADLEQALAAAG